MGTLTYQISKLYLEDIGFGTGTTTQVRGGTTVSLTEINAANMPFDASNTLQDIYDAIVLLAAQCAADVVLTNADVVLTNADVVLTHADVVITNADAASTSADAIATAADAIASAANAVNAAASEVNALDSELNAASWADEAEDVPVKVYTNGVGADRVPTAYSAKHWTAKTQAIAAGSIDGLSDVDTTGKQTGDALVWNGVTGNWEASSIAVPTPSITISSPINEGQAGNAFTIPDYNAEYKYFISSDIGTINYTTGNSGTFDAPDVTDGNDDIATISIYATFGFFTSATHNEEVTITYVPIIADTAVTYTSTEFTTTNY